MKSLFENLDNDLREVLKSNLRDVWTHSSTALEGNSLSLGETSFLLQEGLTIKGKPLKDHNEVSGHASAIELIYKLLEKETLTQEDLFQLHKMVMLGAPMDIYSPVGAYKVEDNYTALIGGGVSKYPSPKEVPELMKLWLESFNRHTPDLTKEDALAAYASTHVSFTKIHPFADGNGRLARLLANIPVLRSGLPPITISSEDREDYIKILQEYALKTPHSLDLNTSISSFCKFVEWQWQSTIDIHQEILHIQNQRNLDPSLSI